MQLDLPSLKFLISVLHFSQQAQARLAGENVTRLLGTSEYNQYVVMTQNQLTNSITHNSVTVFLYTAKFLSHRSRTGSNAGQSQSHHSNHRHMLQTAQPLGPSSVQYVMTQNQPTNCITHNSCYCVFVHCEISFLQVTNGFESGIVLVAPQQSQTYALDRSAIGTNLIKFPKLSSSGLAISMTNLIDSFIQQIFQLA